MKPAQLSQRLDNLDRQALRAIVDALLQHDPELEVFVLPLLPGGLGPGGAEILGDRAGQILAGMSDHWQASGLAAMELSQLVAVADDTFEQGELDDAVSGWLAITRAILTHYLDIRDEESEVAGIVEDCVDGLGRCLPHLEAPQQRRELLGELFDIYRWDTFEHGGFGMTEPALRVIRQQATAEERSWLASMVLDAVDSRAPDDWSGRQGRRHGGRLVIELLGQSLDDLGRLQVQARAGLWAEQVALLLKLGRRDEALQAAEQVDGWQLLQVAESLESAGLTDEAVALVWNHAAVVKPDAHRLRSWLDARGRPVSPAMERMGTAMGRMKYKIDIGTFETLCAMAEEVGRLAQALAHAETVVRLDRKGDQPVRVRLLARQHRFDEALALLEELPASAWKNAAAAIADAARRPAPAVARQLYATLVDKLVARNTKPGREEAALYAEWLARMDDR